MDIWGWSLLGHYFVSYFDSFENQTLKTKGKIQTCLFLGINKIYR